MKSVAARPAIIRYSIRPISDLVADPAKRAVCELKMLGVAFMAFLGRGGCCGFAFARSVRAVDREVDVLLLFFAFSCSCH